MTRFVDQVSWRPSWRARASHAHEAGGLSRTETYLYSFLRCEHASGRCADWREITAYGLDALFPISGISSRSSGVEGGVRVAELMEIEGKGGWDNITRVSGSQRAKGGIKIMYV
jgi:hypothetical protein